MTKLAAYLTVVAALWPAVAEAHRLDEYVHAARLALSRDGVQVEMDLLPGVSIAPETVRNIDRDRDGRISGLEAEAYAREVVGNVTLSVDGQNLPLSLRHVEIAPVGSLLDGTGSVTLIASIEFPTSPGRHQVFFRNHQPSPTVVYLANALIPESSDLVIDSQIRDPQQSELRVVYDVAARTEAWWLLAWPAMAGLLVARRRASFRR